MSNPWCYGGLWPTPGMDAFDITEAIHDVRASWSPHSRPSHARTSSEPIRESEVSMWSPITGRAPSLRWEFDGEFPGGDRFFEGTSAGSAQESRERTTQAQALKGLNPEWDMHFDYFPFAVELYVHRDAPEEDSTWNVALEYLWLAEHVLVPRGWASCVVLPFAEPRQAWGTAPGRAEPFQLPPDVLWVESDAWSLLDRPPA